MVERAIYFSHTTMKRFPIIQADLIQENIGTESQRQELLDQALEAYNNNETPMSFSNEGCWRSQFRYRNISWLIDEIRQAVNFFIEIYKETDPSYATKVKYFGDAEINYWTNVNKPGSKNNLHNHSLHHYVAVYYLQGKDTGDILFHNSSNLTEGCTPYAPFVSKIAWSPKDGDLLAWPAWVPHETDINNSDRHRINIAFNIRFQTPQMIYENY